MATEVRCNGCREWISAKERACPKCAKERPAHNSWLVVANMNKHLHAEMARADADR